MLVCVSVCLHIYLFVLASCSRGVYSLIFFFIPLFVFVFLYRPLFLLGGAGAAEAGGGAAAGGAAQLAGRRGAQQWRVMSVHPIVDDRRMRGTRRSSATAAGAAAARAAAEAASAATAHRVRPHVLR